MCRVVQNPTMVRGGTSLTTAMLVLLSGCAGLGSGGDGLILRHLPMITARGDIQPEQAHVVRDRSCWERSIEEWDLSLLSPEAVESLGLLLDQSMDVDFDKEMVIFYVQPGCNVPMNIHSVYQTGNHLWVEIVVIYHPVTCMAAWPTHDAVVVPKSDAEVTIVTQRLYGYVFPLPLPPEISSAITIDGPCTQAAP